MRGDARLLCALSLVLLCVAAHFQGAYCRGGGGGGHGGGGGGHGGGGGGHGGGSGHGGGGRGHEGGGGGRSIIYGPGAGRSGSHGHSAVGEPRRRAAWRFSGAAATLAAAALVRWL